LLVAIKNINEIFFGAWLKWSNNDYFFIIIFSESCELRRWKARSTIVSKRRIWCLRLFQVTFTHLRYCIKLFILIVARLSDFHLQRTHWYERMSGLVVYTCWCCLIITFVYNFVQNTACSSIVTIYHTIYLKILNINKFWKFRGAGKRFWI